MNISVTHLQSATQIIKLGKYKILTDPWLTEGEYMGSWFHFPPFEESEISNLDYDYIYVSHIHPDHLSEKTFKKLSKKVPVFILKYKFEFLKKKIESFGFDVIELISSEKYKLDMDSSITIYAADNCDPELCFRYFGCGDLEESVGSTQIDSMAVFEYKNKAILNTNDCPYELAEKTILKNSLNSKSFDLLLVGYSGAGAYPQCFTQMEPKEMLMEAQNKKKLFLKSAVNYINLIKPIAYAPFAGTYVLGSKLNKLSEYRGVPTILESINFIDQNKCVNSSGIHLEQKFEYNLENRELIKHRNTSKINFEDYMKYISRLKLDYEDDNWDKNLEVELVEKSYLRFKKKSEELNLKSRTVIYICTGVSTYSFGVFEEIKASTNFINNDNFLKIELHYNLFNRLIRGPKYAHWNNAEIGSHLKIERRPNIYERGLFYCLSFFHA